MSDRAMDGLTDPALDQLFAEMLANRILCMRMWGYIAMATGDEINFIARQLKMSLESVDAWTIEGHPDPDHLKRMAKTAINSAFDGIVTGRASGPPVQ